MSRTRLLALAILLPQKIQARADETATCNAATSCPAGSFCNAEPGIGQDGDGTCTGCADGHSDRCFATDLTAAGADHCFRSCYCVAPEHTDALLHVNGAAVESLPFFGGFVGGAAGPLVDAGLGTKDASAYTGENDISGSVCLVERGDISFYDKVANCQAKGGIGAVIFNNEPGELRGVMTADEDTGIPAVAVGMAEGEELKRNAIGAAATLRLCEQSPSNVIEDSVATVAQVIVAKLSGSLSVISSSFIIRNIYKKWRTSTSNEHLPTSARVVLSMSVADLGSSLWGHVISTWMMPKGYDVPFASGNAATCSAQAFLLQFFVFSGAWSNALLAVTYWLIVCREIPESELRRWCYQLPLLGWPWLFGLAMALINIISAGGGDVYYNIWHCSAWAGGWAMITCIAFLGFGLVMILFSMASLIRNIYLAEKQLGGLRHGEQSASMEQTLQVSKQGVSFIVVYLVIFIPVVVDMLASAPYWFYVFYACVMPSQGFLNALVFFRPKFKSARKTHDGSSSKIDALLQVLDVTPPRFVTSLVTTSVSSFRGILRGTSTRSNVARRTATASQAGEILPSGHESASVVARTSCAQELGEVEDPKALTGSEPNAVHD